MATTDGGTPEVSVSLLINLYSLLAAYHIYPCSLLAVHHIYMSGILSSIWLIARLIQEENVADDFG